jgi:hypothetical protein
MEIVEARNCPQEKIETFPYKGEMHDVIRTSIAWLSQFGADGNGYPEHGLRYFTIEPGGEIPIHNHFYFQTMFILDGTFECYAYDPKTDTEPDTDSDFEKHMPGPTHGLSTRRPWVMFATAMLSGRPKITGQPDLHMAGVSFATISRWGLKRFALS